MKSTKLLLKLIIDQNPTIESVFRRHHKYA